MLRPISHERILESMFGTVWASDPKRGEYKVTCPYCNVKALWINVWSGVYHCFSCTAGGSADKLIPEWYDLFGLKTQNVPVHNQVNRYEGPCELPSTYLEVKNRADFPEGWNYIESRGIKPDGIEWGFYDEISVCFPFREQGEVVYWQARRIYGVLKRKTMNPSNTIGKSHFLYNVDGPRMKQPIMLVEGIFDALRTGGVASCGKTLSETQIDKLLARRPSCVLVCYDGDAYDASVVASDAIRRHGVYHPAIPIRLPEDKDPADLGPEGMIEVLEREINEKRVYLTVVGVRVEDILMRLRETLRDVQREVCL